MVKKTSLILLILGLSYGIWWMASKPHLQQMADDENVGKTLLIHHSAGEILLNRGWYADQKFGDSYFTSRPPLPEGDVPPKLYRVVGKYRTVSNGLDQINGPEFSQYLLKPIEGNIHRRLFSYYLDTCEQQTDLIDPITGILVDFLCR